MKHWVVVFDLNDVIDAADDPPEKSLVESLYIEKGGRLIESNPIKSIHQYDAPC